MINIYIAAFKEFGDYALLKKVCDYFLSRQNKENVNFFVSVGESGDNTCMKHVRDNGYSYTDWLPIKQGKNRAKEKLKFIKESDHCILVHDGYSRGIDIALKYAVNNVKGKVVVIYPYINEINVWNKNSDKPIIKKIYETK